MSQNTPPLERSHLTWVFLAAGGVLLWRLAAFRWPSPFVSLPDGLRLPMALLGFLFLACGVGAWWARPDRWTAAFLLYGLGGGVHWGGSIGSRGETLELSLFFVYLAFTALADASLLHLALIYPGGGPLAWGWRAALYAPAAYALLFAGIAGFMPQTILRTAAGVLLLVANLLSLVAGIVFLIRLFTADRDTRRAARLPLIVTAMVIGSVVALLGAGGALPGDPEAWNLALGVIPISLAVALVSRDRMTP